MLEWLVQCNALQTCVMRYVQQPSADAGFVSRFITELRNGIVLAQLAVKLSGRDLRNEISARPTLEIQKTRNIGLFIRICRDKGIKARFQPHELMSDDVPKKVIEGILKTLFDVSKKLEKSSAPINGFGDLPNIDELLQAEREAIQVT